MKTIIVGPSRLSLAAIAAAVGRSGFEVSKLCSLGDGPAERWAHQHDIPVERFEAQPEWLDSDAGSTRAQLMADEADLLIVVGHIPDPETRELVRAMEQRRKQLAMYLD